MSHDSWEEIETDILNAGWELFHRETLADGLVTAVYQKMFSIPLLGITYVPIVGVGPSLRSATEACLRQVRYLNMYEVTLKSAVKSRIDFLRKDERPVKKRSMEQALTMVKRWSAYNVIRHRSS